MLVDTQLLFHTQLLVHTQLLFDSLRRVLLNYEKSLKQDKTTIKVKIGHPLTQLTSIMELTPKCLKPCLSAIVLIFFNFGIITTENKKKVLKML